jgi:hypothetical protein
MLGRAGFLARAGHHTEIGHERRGAYRDQGAVDSCEMISDVVNALGVIPAGGAERRRQPSCPQFGILVRTSDISVRNADADITQRTPATAAAVTVQRKIIVPPRQCFTRRDSRRTHTGMLTAEATQAPRA